MAATLFEDDDWGYVNWLRQKPDGYVVECNSNLIPTNVTVHRATCPSISEKRDPGESWTVPDKKVCGDRLSELDGWAMGAVGTQPDRCGQCLP